MLNLDPVLVLSVLLPLNALGLVAWWLAVRHARAAESRHGRPDVAATRRLLERFRAE